MNAKSEPLKRFLGRDGSRACGRSGFGRAGRPGLRREAHAAFAPRRGAGPRAPSTERAHLGLQLLAQRALVGFGRPAPRRGGFLRFPQLFLESGQRRRRLSDACGGETPGVTDRGFSRFA